MMEHDDMRRPRGANAALDALFLPCSCVFVVHNLSRASPDTHAHTPQWRSRGSVTVPCITLSIQYEIPFVLALCAFLDTRGKDEKKGSEQKGLSRWLWVVCFATGEVCPWRRRHLSPDTMSRSVLISLVVDYPGNSANTL